MKQARPLNNHSIRVALCQMSCGPVAEKNVEHALAMIAEAAQKGANIICLQELFATPYPCQSEDHTRFSWAETIPGPTSEKLSQAARKHEVVIVGSLFEKRTHGLYHNTAVTFDVDGSLAAMYRKNHIPDDPHYYEKFYFAPGDLGYTVAKTKLANIGVGVCWDQWFPEVARLLALNGAEILFYPTAIGWLHGEKEEYGAQQHDAWQTSMRAHAIANGLYVAAANRTGVEDHIEFWGQSFICNPNGTIIARGDESSQEVLVADCDLANIDVVRTHWPFLRDRRVETYAEIQRRYVAD